MDNNLTDILDKVIMSISWKDMTDPTEYHIMDKDMMSITNKSLESKQ